MRDSEKHGAAGRPYILGLKRRGSTARRVINYPLDAIE